VPALHRTAAIALALLSIVVFAGPALALSWGPYRLITSSGAGIAIPGSTVAYADGVAVAYVDFDGAYGVYVRRSMDGGTTWTAPSQLSASGTQRTRPALAASGNRLDAVFTDSNDGGATSRVIYRTSANGGGTWSPPLALSPAGSEAGSATVAHSGSQVVVAWTNAVTGKVGVRVSDDGGTTFKPRSDLATSANEPHPGLVGDPTEAWATVAISDGRINVAYHTSHSTLKLRRSGDGGESWTAAVTLATNGVGLLPPSLASGGVKLLIGYTVQTSSGFVYAAHRRSADRGATWSPAVALSGTLTAATAAPVITFRASRWRVAFVRFVGEAETHIYYRQSLDGVSWGTATKAVSGPRPSQFPVGVTHDNGKVIIVYNTSDGTGLVDVRVRQGS
jgi:BNR repeat-like domain